MYYISLHPSAKKYSINIQKYSICKGLTLCKEKLLQGVKIMTVLKPIVFSFQEHFTEVIKNQEFLLLPANEIAKLLSSDDINVPDEEAIFQALMMWVRHDLQNRQRDLGMLLSYIRLPLLPPQVWK